MKKDTWDLEDEIAKLEAAGDTSDVSRLADLKAELEKINRKKAEYVTEHPEQRRLVYRPRRKEGDKAEEEPVLLKRNLFDKNGLPRHPERSVYYDPVMNPFGVPPPGMPFMQRLTLPGEVWSDDETDDGDEIAMPKGPPPGSTVEEDDDIPMPEGPPPGKPSPAASPSPPLPPNFSGVPNPPPLPPGPPPRVTQCFSSTCLIANILHSQNPQPRLGTPGSILPPPPPPPPGFVGNPPPPFGIPYPPPPGVPYSPFPGVPPAPHAFPNFPPPGFPTHPLPPPPPGFFPKRNQSASSIQDPLSSIPHKTFQAHREQTNASAHPSLPPNPKRNSVGPLCPPSFPQKPITDKTGAELGAATISSAPQLRDFKKEATAFVPSALKRRKPGASGSAVTRVDAAPSVGPDTDAENSEIMTPARPDLLSTLKDRFGPVPAAEASPDKKRKVDTNKKDDYEKFVEDVLRTAK